MRMYVRRADHCGVRCALCMHVEQAMALTMWYTLIGVTLFAMLFGHLGDFVLQYIQSRVYVCQQQSSCRVRGRGCQPKQDVWPRRSAAAAKSVAVVVRCCAWLRHGRATTKHSTPWP